MTTGSPTSSTSNDSPWRQARRGSSRAGVCLDEHARVRLCLNHRAEWELPRGRPEPGESYPHCLVREIEEEIGLRAAVNADAVISAYPYEVLPSRRGADQHRRCLAGRRGKLAVVFNDAAPPGKELKYARPERERRFLLSAPPADGIVKTVRIADRYLLGTRLRLRRITEISCAGDASKGTE